MEAFVEIETVQLNKHGEQLCGDRVLVHRTPGRAVVILSDGLGSGVKANILATLTTTIIRRMISAGADLGDVVDTIAGTLPVCQVRGLAYATFALVEVDTVACRLRAVNYDNPPILFFRRGRRIRPESRTEPVRGRQVSVMESDVEMGDHIVLMSDGVTHAAPGNRTDRRWDSDAIAAHLEKQIRLQPATARSLVRNLAHLTSALYHGRPSDDATIVGLHTRQRASLMIFTGPPQDPARDFDCAERLLNFPGRRVICGGTTATIVGMHLAEVIETDLATMREGIPPIGLLREVDLVTEGMLTMLKALDLLRDSCGDPQRLPRDRNGAVLLARELLAADVIEFLVGLKTSDYYQNVLLPGEISVRKNLVRELESCLTSLGKEVNISYC
ncbi:MAG: serine/threonine-protein phosphatase [Candidatus Sumerlaeaceae bacterium]|nr:serine/threonine-protein phosphatase [Candidatus Sumerlaeaceae bacterium]